MEFEALLTKDEERAGDDTGFDSRQSRDTAVRILDQDDGILDADSTVGASDHADQNPDAALALRGLLATRRQDWDDAHAAWTAHLARNPGDWPSANAIDRLTRVRQLAQASETPDRTRSTPIAPQVSRDEDVRQLLLKFESIGTDCEFGTVQRRFGAEPLGLLRWNETTYDSLKAALAARFQDMGDPVYTRLHVAPPHREIYLYDTRWRLLMNTFLYVDEVDFKTLIPKFCRYTAYLRDRFLEDLASGRKTLVFKCDTITRAELLALHDLCLSYGPVRLLNVRLAAGSHDFPAGAAGNVSEVRPGLYVGRLHRFVIEPDAEYQDWVAICRAVDRLVSTAIAESACGDP